MDVSVKVLNENPDYDVRFEEVRTRKGDVSSVQKDFTFSADSWFKKFVQEHSTIEVVLLRITFHGVKKSVRNQIVRATKQHPRFFVGSDRPDRNGGKPRDHEALEDFDMVVNPLGLISIARQRLCMGTEIDTRDAVTKLKLRLLLSTTSPLLSALGSALVPNCVYRGGCTENVDGRDCFGVCNKNHSLVDRYAAFDAETLEVLSNDL